MNTYDKLAMLDSMKILVDSREQQTERSRKRYESFGVPYERATLSYGDYTYNAQLPNGEWLYKPGVTVAAPLVIERKMNLDELANCFTHSRKRFEREFQRAKDHNARVFLLCEDATWENLINGKYRSKFNSNAYLASLCAWIVRYDLCFINCKAESTGKIIKEFLYRDLSERIDRGEFDGPGSDKE